MPNISICLTLVVSPSRFINLSSAALLRLCASDASWPKGDSSCRCAPRHIETSKYLMIAIAVIEPQSTILGLFLMTSSFHSDMLPCVAL